MGDIADMMFEQGLAQMLDGDDGWGEEDRHSWPYSNRQNIGFRQRKITHRAKVEHAKLLQEEHNISARAMRDLPLAYVLWRAKQNDNT